MKLRNVNPLGEVDVPLLGRVLAAGEEFEVSDETGAHLLEQVGNYELADPEELTIPALVEYADAHAVDLSGATKKADIVAKIEKGSDQ